jgi:hypothetical protein
MDVALGGLISAFLNQNSEKKRNGDLLEFEILNLTYQLLKKNEDVSDIFDFFLYSVQRKNYSVQMISCKILKRYDLF